MKIEPKRRCFQLSIRKQATRSRPRVQAERNNLTIISNESLTNASDNIVTVVRLPNVVYSQCKVDFVHADMPLGFGRSVLMACSSAVFPCRRTAKKVYSRTRLEQLTYRETFFQNAEISRSQDKNIYYNSVTMEGLKILLRWTE